MTKQKPIDDSRCDSVCSGDKSKTCGGYLTLSVYSTGYGGKYSQQVIFSRSEYPATQKNDGRSVYRQYNPFGIESFEIALEL